MTRAAAAIIFEIVFFALAFGWRSWVQWRRTGSTGFIRPRRDAGGAELAGSIGFVAALALLIGAPVAELVGMARFEALDTRPVAIAGVVLCSVGIALTLVAQLSMGDSWRIGVEPTERTDLVTDGVFAYVRNPIFTAMLIAAVGLLLLVPNVLSAAAVLVLLGALQVQVRLVEEPYLRTTHSVAYQDYARHTGRFIPAVGCDPGR